MLEFQNICSNLAISCAFIALSCELLDPAGIFSNHVCTLLLQVYVSRVENVTRRPGFELGSLVLKVDALTTTPGCLVHFCRGLLCIENDAYRRAEGNADCLHGLNWAPPSAKQKYYFACNSHPVCTGSASDRLPVVDFYIDSVQNGYLNTTKRAFCH